MPRIEVPLGFGGLAVPLGSPIASFYRNLSELRGVVVPFIQKGLEQGDRCICIVHEETRDGLQETLQDQGVDVEAALESGQLRILTAKRHGRYACTLVSDLGRLSPEVLSPTTLEKIYALAATVDAKDPFTYGHSTRVAAISEMVGKTIGLPQKELVDLHVASLLHDIGKLGAPDSILTEPCELTDGEWELMRKHCAEGAKYSWPC